MKLGLEWAIPSCVNCEQASLLALCESCLKKSKLKKTCLYCGGTKQGSVCVPCLSENQKWIGFDIPYKFDGPFKRYLSRIKLQFQLELLKDAVHFLGNFELKQTYDFMVSVPSDPVQSQKRGFDFSLELLKLLSKRFKIPIQTGLFSRRPFLCPTSQLNKTERRRSLERCLTYCENETLQGKRALLVDDVLTTGTSIDLCGSYLRNSGVETGLFCLARTLKSASICL